MARQSWGQYNHRHSKDHIHVHQTGATMSIRAHVPTGTLIKQYSVEWSALRLWKAWQLWRQDIHRHHKDHIHIHHTGATMFIRVHVAMLTNLTPPPFCGPFALQLLAVRAVQGDCERVYSGQPWEGVTQGLPEVIPTPSCSTCTIK